VWSFRIPEVIPQEISQVRCSDTRHEAGPRCPQQARTPLQPRLRSPKLAWPPTHSVSLKRRIRVSLSTPSPQNGTLLHPGSGTRGRIVLIGSEATGSAQTILAALARHAFVFPGVHGGRHVSDISHPRHKISVTAPSARNRSGFHPTSTGGKSRISPTATIKEAAIRNLILFIVMSGASGGHVGAALAPPPPPRKTTRRTCPVSLLNESPQLFSWLSVTQRVPARTVLDSRTQHVGART
jgi:hypothetical protein